MKLFEETDIQDIDIDIELDNFISELLDDSYICNDKKEDNIKIKDRKSFLSKCNNRIEKYKEDILMHQVNNYVLFKHIRENLEEAISSNADANTINQLKDGLLELLDNINSGNTEINILKETHSIIFQKVTELENMIQ